MVCDRFIFQSHSVFGRPTLFAFPTTSIIQFFNTSLCAGISRLIFFPHNHSDLQGKES